MTTISHRGMLKTMLGSWGYTVDEATDGDEAVDRVRERPLTRC